MSISSQTWKSFPPLYAVRINDSLFGSQFNVKNMSINSIHRHNTISFVHLCIKHDSNIFVKLIVPYLDKLTDLFNLAHTCRELKSLIFSEEISEIWSNQPIDICLDSACCFGCGRVRMPEKASLYLISEAPLEYLRMHIPFELLGKLMSSILVKCSIKRLHLRFRSNENVNSYSDVSLQLEEIKNRSDLSRINVANLTVFGWPAKISNNSRDEYKSCLQFLDIIGGNLSSLQLMESSPPGLLSMIQSTCRRLNFLALEGIQCSCDISAFELSSLKCLSLQNIGVNLSSPLRLHNLERLEFAEGNSLVYKNELDIQMFINSIPQNIRELEVKFDSRFADIIIKAISKLSHLESLAMHFTDNSANSDNPIPDISVETMTILKDNCQRITSFELVDSFVAFAPNAFEVLGEFKSLQRIKVFFDDAIISSLSVVLSNSKSVEEVVLLENAGELYAESGGLQRWNDIEESLQKLSEKFPCVVVGLSDCWWL